MSRTSRIRCAALGAALAAAGLACGSAPPPPEPPEPPRLGVSLLAGLPALPPVAGAGAAPVHVVLDATSSMTALRAGRATRYDTARHLLTRLLQDLPADTALELRAIGLTEGPCAAAFPIVPGPESSPVEGLARLTPLLPPPRSEGSLADALDAVARALDRDPGLPGAHVVVLSDFEPDLDCLGDPCAAAAALVARGASLDAVAVADAEPPACWTQLASDGPPRLAGLRTAAPEPAFRVETLEAPDAPARELVRGRAGGPPVSLPAARVTVTVDLAPPLFVSPVELVPGSRLRVRVVSFPALDPPIREAWVENAPAPTPDAPARVSP